MNIFQVATLLIFGLFLVACGGGGTSSNDAPDASSLERPWSYTKTTGTRIVDIRLENSRLVGHVCEDAYKNFELELFLGNERVGSSRTEWASAPDHPCTEHKRFSRFVLQWPAQAHSALMQQGGVLHVRFAGKTLESVVIPRQPIVSPARVQLTSNTSEGLSGVYCADDGVPFVRARLSEVDHSVTTGKTVTSPWSDCVAARGFTLTAAELQAAAISRGWFPSDELTLWAGPHAQPQPVAVLTWRAPTAAHGLAFWEVGAEAETALAALPFSVDASLYPTMTMDASRSPSEEGTRQGQLSRNEYLRGRTTIAAYGLLGTNKRLKTATPNEDIQAFAQAYRAQAQRDPDVLYILDEPFWTIQNGLVDLNTVEEHYHDYMKVVSAYRAAFPHSKLMAAVNGVVLHEKIYPHAKSLLSNFDILAFDPYIVYTSVPFELYESAFRVGRCSVQQGERLDIAVSECLAQNFQDNPRVQYGWAAQGFTVHDQADGDVREYAPYNEGLQRHLRAMAKIAYQHRQRSLAVSAFGILVQERLHAAEPYLVEGRSLLPSLMNDFRAFAGR